MSLLSRLLARAGELEVAGWSVMWHCLRHHLASLWESTGLPVGLITTRDGRAESRSIGGPRTLAHGSCLGLRRGLREIDG